MAAPTYTLTGNVHDLVGNAPTSDTSGLRVRGYLEASQQLINDSSANEQRIGRYPFAPDPSTGAFSVTAQGTGTNVAGYRVVLAYTDATPGAAQQTFTSGWFALTADTALAVALQSTITMTQVDTSIIASVGSQAAAAQAAAAQALTAAAQAAALVPSARLNFVSLDTDGVPDFVAQGMQGSGAAVYLDSDGVPFYDTTGAGGVPLVADLDSIPYLYGV